MPLPFLPSRRPKHPLCRQSASVCPAPHSPQTAPALSRRARRKGRLKGNASFLFVCLCFWVHQPNSKCCAGLPIDSSPQQGQYHIISQCRNIIDTHRYNTSVYSDHYHRLYDKPHKCPGKSGTEIINGKEYSCEEITDPCPCRSKNKEGKRKNNQTTDNRLGKTANCLRNPFITRFFYEVQKTDCK